LQDLLPALQNCPVAQHVPKQHSPLQLAHGLHLFWFGSVQLSLDAQQAMPHACAFPQQVLELELTQTSSIPSQQLLPQTAPCLQQACVLGLQIWSVPGQQTPLHTLWPEAQQFPSPMQVSVAPQQFESPQGLRPGEQHRPTGPTQFSPTSQHVEPTQAVGQQGPPPLLL
jgi:hypothetical protein